MLCSTKGERVTTVSHATCTTCPTLKSLSHVTTSTCQPFNTVGHFNKRDKYQLLLLPSSTLISIRSQVQREYYSSFSFTLKACTHARDSRQKRLGDKSRRRGVIDRYRSHLLCIMLSRVNDTNHRVEDHTDDNIYDVMSQSKITNIYLGTSTISLQLYGRYWDLGMHTGWTRPDSHTNMLGVTRAVMTTQIPVNSSDVAVEWSLYITRLHCPLSRVLLQRGHGKSIKRKQLPSGL